MTQKNAFYVWMSLLWIESFSGVSRSWPLKIKKKKHLTCSCTGSRFHLCSVHFLCIADKHIFLDKAPNIQHFYLFLFFQAAYVATPGKALAQSMTSSSQYGTVSASDKVLFVTFTSDEDPSTSAMCECQLGTKLYKDSFQQIFAKWDSTWTIQA